MKNILWTIIIILVIIWFLGLIVSHPFGGLVHVLLVIAIILIVVRLLQGRKAA